MRVVLDTNVLVAAFIAHGTCSEVLEHCAVRHQLVLSGSILGEFRAVLVRKFGFAPAEAGRAAQLIESRSLLVEPQAFRTPICRDPDDDLVIGTALAGGCRCLVTGDEDLLSLKEHQEVRIVSPGMFWRFEKEQGERRTSGGRDAPQQRNG